jgi:hypothetical protein
MMSEQLYELARPFPDRLVKQKPGKFSASYVEHSVISQRLLEVVGPHTFTVDNLSLNPDGVVVGCLATLEVMVDGDFVTITEVGDVEHPSDEQCVEPEERGVGRAEAVRHAARRRTSPVEPRQLLSGQGVGEASGDRR